MIQCHNMFLKVVGTRRVPFFLFKCFVDTAQAVCRTQGKTESTRTAHGVCGLLLNQHR